jgi:lipoprotein NlpD
VTSYDPEPITKGFHEVVRGDTLYSISFRYGLDYRDVAGWNGISGQFLIYPGQRIRLIPDPAKPAARRPAPTATTRQAPAPASAPDTRPVPSISSTRPPPKTEPVINQQNIRWRWPTEGLLQKSSTPIAQKGLDITGKEGQDIQAAAEGIVVYSGSGLLGYGKLIIIKHNETYLSAYAHNQFMQVKEGDKVNAGQKIATMGKGNKGQPLLHFEIRKEGKPVDPLQYLPVRS